MVYCGIRALASLYKLCQLVAFSMHFSRPLMISFSSLLLDSTRAQQSGTLAQDIPTRYHLRIPKLC